jgi:hypothetical protein
MQKQHRDRFDHLLRIAVSYEQQAKKCARAKAYHASSILLTSAVEALILAMYYCFTHQARDSRTYQSLKERKKNILYWDLFQLVKLAKELKWIPARRRIGRSNYSISHAVDQLRKTRNTIHPGNYLRTQHGRLIGAKDFRHATKVFRAFVESLESAL